MSEFDFILDGIRYSYSSVSTYNNCHYSFKLAYIDQVPRENNFFGEYGTLIHECMEQYFSGNLDTFELSEFYRKNYESSILSPAPSSYVDLNDRYKKQGQEFFDNFYFDKNKYEVLIIEDKIDFSFDDIMVVAKPDLVLKDKLTNKCILFDYKTADPFKKDKRTGKETVDNEKIEGYMKQMYLYTYALREHRGIPIEKITLWFTRAGREYSEDWTYEKECGIIDKFRESIELLKNDKEFVADNSNPYFCNNLCGVRESCQFRPK